MLAYFICFTTCYGVFFGVIVLLKHPNILGVKCLSFTSIKIPLVTVTKYSFAFHLPIRSAANLSQASRC